MAHQHKISAQRLSAKIDTQQTIVIDEMGLDNIAIGRTQYDAPEIDGRVIIEGAPQLNAGDIVKATITDSDDHDLFANV
jgi:ribosomal protein S12 methylthiotransferase